MKLHRSLPMYNAHTAQQVYTNRWMNRAGTSLSLQTSSGCLEKCAGSAASACAGCALTDYACWSNCAGEGAAKCIMNCNKAAMKQYQGL
ncbi:hypothetical protein LX64_02181 [Chitinophaga skermanii]|uniref:Uncharacterized protein n=1 Tax=Chitinophaga skermanii TaxID=331697 RepID=A0A327QTE3_9BACT|nr:hypothetical protein [Chitinophaga skermanii]RAJ05027.1 hypothetical protein LX64_02181 [Chitinophaga skermanii]